MMMMLDEALFARVAAAGSVSEKEMIRISLKLNSARIKELKVLLFRSRAWGVGVNWLKSDGLHEETVVRGMAQYWSPQSYI